VVLSCPQIIEVTVREAYVRWADFEIQQPDLAELGKRKLGEPGLVIVGTIRRDGSVRLSPVSPHFWDDDLCLSMASTSRKVGDLIRDDRLVVHNAPGRRDGGDGEYKVRGRAVLEAVLATQSKFASTVKELYGWGPEVGSFHLFRVDVLDLTFIDRGRSKDPNNPDITRWPGK
jgi:hypothetical protein